MRLEDKTIAEVITQLQKYNPNLEVRHVIENTIFPCKKKDRITITKDGYTQHGTCIGFTNTYSSEWQIVISVDKYGDVYMPISQLNETWFIDTQ